MKISKLSIIAIIGLIAVSSVRADDVAIVEDVTIEAYVPEPADKVDNSELIIGIERHIESKIKELLEMLCYEVSTGDSDYIRVEDGIGCAQVPEEKCKLISSVSEKYGIKIKTETLKDMCIMSVDKAQDAK